MTSVGSIARLAVLGGFCLLGFAARAELPANGPAYMDAALGSVESMVRATPGKPTLPRLGDPVDGKILADVWNEDAILGKAPYKAGDIPGLIDIVQKQVRLLQLYSLYAPGQGKQAPDTARNATEFQDELSRSHVFLLKTVAAALQAMNDFGAHLSQDEKTDARFQGLRQMRLGLQEIVASAVVALRNPALREPNQLLIARGLAENAAAIAAGSPAADRTTLVSAADAARAALKPAAQKALADFKATMTAAPCVGLCKLD
ncbi:conserved hypothetical protein [Hyphomicrobiales bacterium]|nr:conserved hypothetical protein [Hyphomicrobiales bacterium]CAH1700624.1 conserved hypothetical protein [Hyphomicrobiales bacterium]CAI0344472.1 conserved hypothetical protein [Hyphomicrobiales bacterium]